MRSYMLQDRAYRRLQQCCPTRHLAYEGFDKLRNGRYSASDTLVQ